VPYCGHCGASRTSDPCPFCGASAHTTDVTGFPVAPDGRAPAAAARRDVPKLVLLGVVGVCIVGAGVSFLLGRNGSEVPGPSAQPVAVAPSSAPSANLVPSPIATRPGAAAPSSAATPTPTPSIDPVAAARSSLAAAYAADRVLFRPRDQWVIQLNSKWHGIVDPNQVAADGSHTFQATDIVAAYQALRASFGDRVLLLQSTDLGKQVAFPAKPVSEPLWTVVYDPGSIPSQEAANAWCRASFPNRFGNDLANVCYPRRATAPHS
jgi:hypothetical protein